MAAQSSYVMVGNREDLADVIYDVSPSDTPVLSAIKKTKAENTKHEYQTDSLAAPSASNAAVEGADAGTPADDPTIRMHNYTQILTKVAKVTGTQEKGMDHAGVRSEMARQMEKKMKEIKTDWEMSAFGANNAYVVGNASTAREMASIQTYLTSNTSLDATSGADAVGAGTSTAGSAARTDSSGTRALTDTILKPVMQDLFDNSGKKSRLLVVDSFNKGKVDDFTGGGTHWIDKDDKKVVDAVDIYITSFGTLNVITSRHVRARDALILDPEYLACADLRGLNSFDLAKVGDSFRKQMVWESTVEVCNEAAHGGVFDLTTS